MGSISAIVSGFKKGRSADHAISYDAHLEPAGLRITQFLTLAALSEAGSVAVNALAERLDIERTAMGKMLGFLERDGLINNHPSPGRRPKSVSSDLHRRGASPTRRSLPLLLSSEVQRRFEELNGAEKVAALRLGLSGMVFGDATAAQA